jgi:hypothetical protein
VPTDTAQPTASPTATSTPTKTPEPTAIPLNGGTCTLKPEPARAAAGTDFTFIGAGFRENEAAAIGLVFPDGSVVGLPGQATNGAGSFAFTYHTEADDPTGLYTLVAEGQSSHCRASGAFYLDDAALPTPVSVVITSPTDGNYGVGGGGPLMLGAALPSVPTSEPIDQAVVAAQGDPLLANIELKSFTELSASAAEPTAALSSGMPGVGGGSLLPIKVIVVLVGLGLIALTFYLVMSGSLLAQVLRLFFRGNHK